VDDLPNAGADVEQFELAADVIAVRNESILRWADDSHVAKHCFLDRVRMVRAQEQADVRLAAEIDIGDTPDRERLAETRGGERVGVALAFELDDVGAGDVEWRLFREPAP